MLQLNIILDIARTNEYECMVKNGLVSCQKHSIKIQIYYTNAKNTIAICKKGYDQRFLYHVTCDKLQNIFQNPSNEYENTYCSYNDYMTKRLQIPSEATSSDTRKTSRKRKRNDLDTDDMSLCSSTKRIKISHTQHAISHIHNHDDQKNDNSSWTCLLCTYLNKLEDIHCAVCENKRKDTHNINTTSNDEWKCIRCTFMNINKASNCKMCNKTRLMDHQWECHVCTMHNDAETDKCVMCNTFKEKQPIIREQHSGKTHDHDGIEDIEEFDHNDGDILMLNPLKTSASKPLPFVNDIGVPEQRKCSEIPNDHFIDYNLFKGNEDKTTYCRLLEQQIRSHQTYQYDKYKKHLLRMNNKLRTQREVMFPYELTKYDHTPETKQMITLQYMRVQRNNNYRYYNNNDDDVDNISAGSDVLLFCSCALNHDDIVSTKEFYERLLRSGRILGGKVVNTEDLTFTIRIKKFCKDLQQFSAETTSDVVVPYHDTHACRWKVNEDKFRFITIQIQLRGIETLFENGNDVWCRYFYSASNSGSNDDLLSVDTTNIKDKVEQKYRHLNPSQITAICNVVQHPISMIQGPPGTGKTYTASHIMEYLLYTGINQRILVTAHTHCAVDQFLDELIEQFPKYKGFITRIGAPSKVSPKLRMCCLDNRIKEYKDEYAQMQQLFNEARAEPDHNVRAELRQEAMARKDELCWRVLESSSIVLGTCYGCCNKYLMNLNPANDVSMEHDDDTDDARYKAFKGNPRTIHIDTILVDEATQIHEPELLSVMNCLSPSYQDKRVVMIGDPKQLSPIVESEKSKRLGYAVSLFERLLYKMPITELVDRLKVCKTCNNVDDLSNFVLLNVQYRGFDLIHDWSNRNFYDGKLQHHKKFNNIRKLLPGYKWKNNIPINFVHIDSEQKSDGKGSYKNIAECKQVVDIALQFMRYHHEHKNRMDKDEDIFIQSFSEIGIITPHKSQQREIKKELHRQCRDWNITKELKISTVDSFQGQQKKLIIYSMTRTDAKSTIFTANPKRINVSFTRSKYGLLVVGNLKQLNINSEIWQDFQEYLKEHEAIDD